MNTKYLDTLLLVLEIESLHLIHYSQTIEANFEKNTTIKGKYSVESLLKYDSEEVYNHFLNDSFFPQIHRNSLFISIYATFEHYLTSLVKSFGEVLDISLQLKDINGSVFEKIKKYLNHLTNVQFPNDVSQWEVIKNLSKVRHCLVHNKGIIEEYNNPEDLLKTVENLKFIYTDFDGIFLEKEFCEYAIETFQEFITILISRIKESN